MPVATVLIVKFITRKLAKICLNFLTAITLLLPYCVPAICFLFYFLVIFYGVSVVVVDCPC